MNSRSVIWWLLFLPVALVIQLAVPGLDALVIGLILTLQERRHKDLLWLLPVLIILQEGMGAQEFGGMVLWYASVIAFFLLGRWLFEVENFLFVFLLSTCLGAGRFALLYVLAPLQDLHIDVQTALDEGVIQALFIPIAWRLAYLSRHWVRNDEENA